MASVVDDKGRVVVPRELRERFGLEPGIPVHFEATRDGVCIRRAIPAKEAFAALVGVIPKRAGKSELDPLDLKRLWEPRP